MGTDRQTWLERLAAILGVEPPTDQEIAALLEVAALAAHTSERTAAPLSCWLVARAGIEPGEAVVVARRLAAELGSASQ